MCKQAGQDSSRVFFNSPLRQKLENRLLPQNYHLLGNSAYPLQRYLMAPFCINGYLTMLEKKYNSAQSSTRVDIQQAFRLLKGKFRRLKETGNDDNTRYS
ncbi:Harbi1_0 protein [Elysia marginata]|uniref:Harbi1_0 protein n=1 Tax=Elysia marginata TaxID=1093978 RepID=A0AAV4JAM8_9GAST|nr:Harbi1_0 protein [Elysia marginata]